MKLMKKILLYVRKQKLLVVSAGILVLLSLVVLEERGAFSTVGNEVRAENGKICVVVDAGHGGYKMR